MIFIAAKFPVKAEDAGQRASIAEVAVKGLTRRRLPAPGRLRLG